ncbi:MAG TPA: hypothetical protein VK427_21080 [Kofleriaceae bacterium]|nr:hypothetical protein [Kofleriaceae bacterium]
MRIFLVAGLLAGCGGDFGTSHEGVFTLKSWTRNTTSCDAEGGSVAPPGQAFFYVKNESFLGSDFINVKGCDDVAGCVAEANEKDTINIGQFALDKGSDGGGWTSHGASGFSFAGSPCEGSVFDLKLAITATEFRLEERRTEAVPFPAETGEDKCPDDKVEKAAAGRPCSELEVVTATFVQDF